VQTKTRDATRLYISSIQALHGHREERKFVRFSLVWPDATIIEVQKQDLIARF
jgi:hypothetical protein